MNTTLDKFDPPCGKRDHSQQQNTVFPAGDIGSTVGAFAVANGQVNDFAVKPGRAENQVIITEGVEVAKIGTVGRDHFIVFSQGVKNLEEYCRLQGKEIYRDTLYAAFSFQ